VAPEAIGWEKLMGKVYDALRRAEQERSERMRAPGALELPFAGTPVLGRERARLRPSLLARWLRRRRTPALEDSSALNKRRIALLRPESFAVEQFRTLRARVDSLAAQHPLRTIALTSAVAGEGKTVASVNFALVNAMSVGRRVLLVDCDLRNPKVHSALGLAPELGLAEVLADRASLAEAVTKLEGTKLEVVAVRGQPPNPAELLASERMKALVAEAAASYDRVILDTPPVLAVPDAKSVSDLADAILLVVQAGSTAASDVTTALDLLERRRVLGVVLNGVEDASDRYGYTA
jgi:capsular exopolysaccharide synthesis family protein